MKQKEWTNIEINYLVDNIEKLGYAQVAYELNRTEDSVKARAKSLRNKFEELKDLKIYKHGSKVVSEINEVKKLAFSKPWV